MPRSNQNQTLCDWESLLRAVRQNEVELAGVTPYREALEHAYRQARSSRAMRDSMAASAADENQRLNQALAAGRDAAICLRSFLKSLFGPRSEKLLRYGIKPQRPRRRTRKTAVGFGPPN
jgi:hypothetical protein